MRIALIMTTYNRPDALDVVLDSIKNQTILPDEILIADDGSGNDTTNAIEHWKEDSTIGSKIRHIWQPDEGFRPGAIRNKAIAKSTCDYIIMIDGDMMLHPKFIEDHKKVIRKGYVVNGCRVRLDEKLTNKICASHKHKNINIMTRGILKDRIKCIRFRPLSKLFLDNFKPHSYYGIGCNMAFWRNDAIAVNGFDETFTGWGHEDSDFLFRLSRIGVKKCDLRFAAVQYHLYHTQRGNGSDNHIILKNRNSEGIIKAIKGIDQYLD